MKTLNELYNNSCKPKYEFYKKITNNITLIDNFFENFDEARNFFMNRDKWKCIPYQGHSKPGYETIFPSWIGRSLLEKYILDNKIIDDVSSYDAICNFMYDLDDPWSLVNTFEFPHIDGVENDGILRQICLINLNLVPTSTKFYSYKNKKYCEKKLCDEWNKYNIIINDEVKNYYNGEDIITTNQMKEFLEKKQNLEIKLIEKIKYKPNQAIIYPENLFHCPSVTKEFTEDNPRILLRISFDQKMVKNKNFKYR